MPEIQVKIKEKSKSYPIKIGKNIKLQLGELIKEKYQGDKILLVTDQNVDKLYGEEVREKLDNAGFKIISYIVKGGEAAKSFAYLKKGYDLLLENNFRRDNLIIALGGGVVGDLAGFLAATFMRGISLIQVPTTLLAQVDSSVGGKTAINHTLGKNLIGSFYQANLVLIDPNFLKTLAVRELKTGMAEVIKYGLIADQQFAIDLSKNKEAIFNLDLSYLIKIIAKSCLIKAKIVSADEKEAGLRAILNYGHTIAHGLEALTSYQKYNHGEAVAIGMIGASQIAYHLGYLEKEDVDFIKDLITLYGLPTSFQYGEKAEELLPTLYFDKKVKNNNLRWILLDKIGHCLIENKVEDKLIKKVLEGLK